MEYTVQKLAKLAGVSTRTLRYYDQIGILKPARINSSGYRIYGDKEINTLQQILFYRELDVSLECIKNIIASSAFDVSKALEQHRQKLLEKRKQLDLLIDNVNRTIASNEGRIIMSDKDKFQGFKQKLIDDNDKAYGEEIRKKYGKEVVDKANNKVKNMTEAEYNEINQLGEEIIKVLKEAIKTGDAAGELAQKAAALHKQWISFYWDSYSKEAHAGVAQMYVGDERFKAYYDKHEAGMAEFLRDAILIYTGMNIEE